MKRSPDNQINASFIDISRIKCLVFYCGRVSVEQTAYRRDNGYKSVFTNSWLVHQRNRSWIKGLCKNPQKSQLHSLTAVPFVRGHRTVSPQTPRNT